MIASLEAEQNVLGCLMIEPQASEEALDRLRSHHFAEATHGRLFEAIVRRLRNGGLADLHLLRDDMCNDRGLEDLGGVRFLADLAERARLFSLSSDVDAILDRSARRAIVTLTKAVSESAADVSQGSADAVIADLERGAAEIAREGSSKPLAVPAGLDALEMLEAAWRGEFAGSSVGLDVIDRVTGGIRQDDVWFIGGRTSMGKSVMGLGLAKAIAMQGRGVLVFSLEMPEREVKCRLIADLAFDHDRRYDGAQAVQVQYADLLRGRGNDALKSLARQAARQLASLPLNITDKGGLTIDDIRSQAQRQVRAWHKIGVTPGAIIIDHIGLVRAARLMDSKAAETAEIVNQLKDIAKQLRCPLIVLCQVNRQTESRNDKRPQLSDLNWSGAIEQIADFICLLYREAYYLERDVNAEKADIAAKEFDLELLIHKNRSGPICNLHAFIDVACNAVRDLPNEGRAYG